MISRVVFRTRTSTSGSTRPGRGSPTSSSRRARPICGTTPTTPAQVTSEMASVREDVELMDELDGAPVGRADAVRDGARRGRRRRSSPRSRRTSRDLAQRSRQARAARAVQRRARRARRDLRGALRRGRYRRAGLGADGVAHDPALGARRRASRSRSTRSARAKRRGSPRRPSSSRVGTRTACSKASGACTG